MRLFWILLLLAFAAAGAIFGALNSDAVDYDFYFTTLRAPKGALLIAAVLLGWLLGGALVYFGLVLRLQRRLRWHARQLGSTADEATSTDTVTSATAGPQR